MLQEMITRYQKKDKYHSPNLLRIWRVVRIRVLIRPRSRDDTECLVFGALSGARMRRVESLSSESWVGTSKLSSKASAEVNQR